MATSWHSLSGYLLYKPDGVLGKLLPNSRNWYVLDERNCRLLSFKSRDAARQKQPDGHIDLRNAAITLSNGNDNQFMVLCDGKEHTFIADNHESCMVWLHGLQAKRTSFSSLSHNSLVLSDDISETKPNENEQQDREVASAPEVGNKKHNNGGSSRGRRQLERQQRIMRLFTHTSTADDAKGEEYSKSGHRNDLSPVSILPSKQSVDSSAMRHHDNKTFHHDDDVFLDSFQAHSLLQQTQSNTSERSGRLASNDSTLDRDSDYSSQLSTQIMELEQQIISTKCELAVMMNRETCFLQLLDQRDSLIKDMTAKVQAMEKSNVDRKSAEKSVKETIERLKNENKFLNTEIRHVAHLQYQDQMRLSQARAEIQALKRDYIYILQSSITVPTGDIIDGTSVSLYGGDVHLQRVKALLEEARESNPSLPTLDSLCSSSVHIDEYGFSHEHKSEGLVLHYAAQQLVKNYNRSLVNFEEHQRAWKILLENLCDDQMLPKCKELKVLCRRGIPPQFRSDVWRRLVYARVKDTMADRGPHYYNHLVNCLHDPQYIGTQRKQISLDLLRTMPYNVNFSSSQSEGVQQMREILEAFSIHNPVVGYCQGMNFIVALCLLIMQPEEAFWTLVAVTEKYFGPCYFDQNLTGAQADQEVLKDIVMETLPDLYRHLDYLDIEISTVTLNWFLALFFDAVPFETLLRIWDCFLLEGPKVLFRFSTAVLKLNEPGLRMKKDTISIMKHLKCCAKLQYDADQLVKTAFEELKPFPRQKDLSAKQVVYLNALKEKMRKRVIYKRSLTESELGLMELEGSISNRKPVVECAIPCESDYVWIVSSSQTASHMTVLNCATSTMKRLELTNDSRVMCGCCINNDVIVIGTLSWHLHAFSIKTREELWCLRLQESVMSVAYHHDDGHIDRLFCGLANGTIAMLEHVETREAIDQHPYYIPISHNAVTSLLVVRSEHIWAGCGPYIYILHALTLDTLEKFSVSSSSFDHVSCLVTADDEDVWVTVKGSCHVQLWNMDRLTCKINFDVSKNKPATQIKNEEASPNACSVTAILPLENSVWIATVSGDLFMYDIREQNISSRRYSLAQSIKSPNSVSGMSSPGGVVETERLLEKVNQLYYDRLFQDRKFFLPLDDQEEQILDKLTPTEPCNNGVRQNDVTQNNVSDETNNTKKKRKMVKQRAMQEKYSNTLDFPVKSINVETGSIEMQEWSQESSLNTGGADSRRQTFSSFDNISLESATSNDASKVRGVRADGPEKSQGGDKASFDSISLTSSSSLEESRAAIARVLQNKLALMQQQRQGHTDPTNTPCIARRESGSSSSSPEQTRIKSGRSHKPKAHEQWIPKSSACLTTAKHIACNTSHSIPSTETSHRATNWRSSSDIRRNIAYQKNVECVHTSHKTALRERSNLHINNNTKRAIDCLSPLQNHLEEVLSTSGSWHSNFTWQVSATVNNVPDMIDTSQLSTSTGHLTGKPGQSENYLCHDCIDVDYHSDQNKKPNQGSLDIKDFTGICRENVDKRAYPDATKTVTFSTPSTESKGDTHHIIKRKLFAVSRSYSAPVDCTERRKAALKRSSSFPEQVVFDGTHELCEEEHHSQHAYAEISSEAATDLLETQSDVFNHGNGRKKEHVATPAEQCDQSSLSTFRTAQTSKSAIELEHSINTEHPFAKNTMTTANIPMIKEENEQLGLTRRPDQLLTPNFIRGVLDTGMPLTPKESPATAQLLSNSEAYLGNSSIPLTDTEPMVKGVTTQLSPSSESYLPRLSPLIEGGSSECESERENGSLTTNQSDSSKISHISANQRARLVFLKQLKQSDSTNHRNESDTGFTMVDNTSSDLISKSEAPCLTTIEEYTEASSCTSPVTDKSERRQSHREPELSDSKVADVELQSVHEGNNCKQHNNPVQNAPPPVIVPANSGDVPGPPNNTPDTHKYTPDVFILGDYQSTAEAGLIDECSSSPLLKSDRAKKPATRRMRNSTVGSGVSTPNEPAVELVLQAKIKISDKPVRCLVQTRLRHEQVIVSCAGSDVDNEAILQWTRLPNESLWTNDVVREERSPPPEPEISTYKKLIRRISNSSFF